MTGRPPTGSTSCEACGTILVPWQLDESNILLRCPSCGHLRRDLSTCPAGHRSFTYGGDPGMDTVRLWLTYRRLVAAVPKAGRVFEVGFGSGGLLRRYLDAGASVAGTDPGHLGGRVDAQVSSRGRLWSRPVEEVAADPSYDLVLGVHVVEHAPDVSAFLEACAGMLRPGGTLALVTPDAGSELLRRSGAAWWMLEDPTHVRFLSDRSAQTLLERAGLVDIRVTRPLLDSMATEMATFARRRVPAGRGDAGVLARRRVRLGALVALPLTLAVRAVRPGVRPSLLIVATRPDGTS